jgi:hypothetical protein
VVEIRTNDELTIKRLFQSGEFEEIPYRKLQRQYNVECFPCRVLQSTNGPAKTLVGVCFQSHSGKEYGVNADLLRFLENEQADQKYLVLACSNDPKNKTIDYLDNQITLQQLQEKLDGVIPHVGKFGNAKFFWIDQNGNSFI